MPLCRCSLQCSYMYNRLKMDTSTSTDVHMSEDILLGDTSSEQMSNEDAVSLSSILKKGFTAIKWSHCGFECTQINAQSCGKPSNTNEHEENAQGISLSLSMEDTVFSILLTLNGWISWVNWRTVSPMNF